MSASTGATKRTSFGAPAPKLHPSPFIGQVTQPAERFAPQSRGRLCDITWHVTVPPERPVSPEILWPGIDKGRYEAAVANAVLGVEERGKPSSRRPDQLRLEPSDGARLHPPGGYDPASCHDPSQWCPADKSSALAGPPSEPG